MARGRPISGVAVVDRLAGPRAVRHRLRVLLTTLTGTCTIREACAHLGVERARLHRLRQQALQGALDALLPRARGRPRSASDGPGRERGLEARIRALELALRATQLRSEIALTMPFLLDRATRKKKHAPPRGRPSSSGARRPRRARARSRHS
jgi:hypothetical protein